VSYQHKNDPIKTLDCRISDNMNQFLLRPFTGDEVKHTLFQMHPLNSRGPDGFSAGFFQNSWGLVGPDITRAVLEVLNRGLVETEINATYICLIPKVSSPSRVNEFRPISLCNVVYKIISKMLANRLKHISSSYHLPGTKCIHSGEIYH
jgi:hypothetical protein